MLQGPKNKKRIFVFLFFIVVLFSVSLSRRDSVHIQYPTPFVKAEKAEINGDIPLKKEDLKKIYLNPVQNYLKNKEEAMLFFSNSDFECITIYYTAQNINNANEYIIANIFLFLLTDGNIAIIYNNDTNDYYFHSDVLENNNNQISIISQGYNVDKNVISVQEDVQLNINLEYLYENNLVNYSDYISIDISEFVAEKY